MNVNSISVGNVIIYNGKYCMVTKREHVKPGKGGAFLQVEMKDIKTGTKLMNRFNTTDDVEKANMEDKKAISSYNRTIEEAQRKRNDGL